ncbi:MAG: pantoate--beta-alanine ligase, partial [Actinomycetes bacterium]
MTTLFTNRSDFQSWRDLIPKDRTIGFVPTMGALHAGHVSLIEHAKSECDVVVVSIYVNDLQFSAESDFTRYPRTEESDFHLCANEQVHAVFAPARSEVFPEEVINVLTPSNNALGFEGTDRQGHFAGVVTVVDRLFSIVRPSVAYFGLKDYQQVAVIRDMALQLHPDIVIESCETVRDADGLALSSRNRFLSVSGRNTATLMNTAFDKAIAIWKSGTTRS